MNEPIHGVVVVDKPVGPTSFSIVRQARKATGARKVGHGGTLDPLASGVLPLCFGEATKLAQFLLDADKEYEAHIAFGAETDTYDADGAVTRRQPAQHLTAQDVRAALGGFLGAQSQVPPMYSALKRDGKPLYAYAREGEVLERTPRTIRIDALEMRAFASSSAAGESLAAENPSAHVFIRCSKGTYVRSLAFDLGRALGTGAHLVGLRRVRSGPFGLDRAVAPESLRVGQTLPVISPADALAHLATLTVCEDVARTLVQGRIIRWENAGAVSGQAHDLGSPIRILAPDGQLLAVAPRGAAADPIRTTRVFRPAESPSGPPSWWLPAASTSVRAVTLDDLDPD